MTAVELPDRLNAAVALVDRHLAEGRGPKTAILCGEQRITYTDLADAVNRLGNALKALGIRWEERVALLMPDLPEMVYAFFGAMKIGAVPIPLNTLLMPSDYESLLNGSRSRALIVHGSLLERVLPIWPRLKYSPILIVAGEAPGEAVSLREAMQSASPELHAADTSKDDAAFWLYSSGTSGMPKGAIHLHHDMVVSADLYARPILGISESDVCYSVAKLFFAYGLGNGLFFPLRVGATTVLLPDRPTPDKVYGVIDRYQPTLFYSVPSHYAALLQRAEETGRTDLGRVRLCVSAGGMLPKSLYERWLQRFRVEALDGIGSTEVLHIYISNRPGKVKPGSTGQIVPGYEARLVDDHGNKVPTGQIGNLLIKGDSTASGYWNHHEQTKKTFEGEWINTRDKFAQDSDGYFWYAGRADDMVKVSGYAVWPDEVEAVLAGHPAVLENAIVGFADRQGLTSLCAYVVLRSGHRPSPDLACALQDFVKSHTAPYKYPRSVEFVDALPRTATGKLQRYKLREMAAQAERSLP